MKSRLYKAFFLCSLVLAVALTGAGCANPFGDNNILISGDNSGDSDRKQPEDPETDPERQADEKLVTVQDPARIVHLGRYQGLVLQKPSVPDEEVEAEIRSRLQTEIPASQEASALVQESDTVIINYVGTIGTASFDGSIANNYRLVIGSHEMQDGFEEALIGMKIGETRSFTLPVQTQDGEVDAVYRVTLQSILRTAELTDEWAQAQGAGSAEAYREEIRKELEEEIDTDAALRNDAWQLILSQSTLSEYPDRDLALAKEEYTQLLSGYAGEADMTLEDFLTSQGIDQSTYESMQLTYAKEKVIQNVIVQAILDQEGITLESESVKAAMEDIAKESGFKDSSSLTDSVGKTRATEAAALRVVQDLAVAAASSSAS